MAFNRNSLFNILNQSIWMSNTESLNDPLDCAPLFELDTEISNKILTKVYASLGESAQKIGRRQFIGENDKLYFSLLRGLSIDKGTFDKVIEKSHKDLYDRLKELDNRSKNIGLASLSREYDSPLLWAHYADSHRGICIEYDIESLGDNRIFQEVDYVCDETERFNIMDDDWLDNKVGNYFAKPKDWSYEKEDRIIDLAKNNYSKDLSIKSVILGYRMNETDRKQVKDVCKDQKIPIHEVKSFGALFRPSVPDLKRQYLHEVKSKHGK